MNPRLQRIGIVLAVVVLVYGLAGFLIAPVLVRSALQRSVDSTLVTHASFARVRVNPFTLAVTVEGLRIPDEHGTPAAGFDRLSLRFDPLRSLWQRAWTLAELRLERPFVSLAILPDRTLSLVRLLRPRPASVDTAGSPPTFQIGRLRVSGGALTYSDRSRQPSFETRLRPIEFDLVDFGTVRGSRNAYSFEASTAASESLFWSGRFTLAPFRSEGELRIADVRARTLADLLGPQTPFAISRGTFTLRSRYRVDARVVPAEIGLTALAFEARDPALVDRESGEEVLSAATLTTQEGALDLERPALDLGRVAAHDPRILLWMRPDGHLSLEHWAAPSAGDTSRPMVTSIARAHVDGLAFEFQDRRLEPSARFRIRSGSADVESLSTAPGRSFHFALACSLGVAGHASASGLVSPAAPSADLALEVHGFDLRDLQPYVQAFARLDITRGAVDGKGRLAFNTFGAKGPLVRFTGDVSSSDFLSVDHKVGKEFLAWKRLDLNGLAYDALPGRLALREVVATKPFLRAIVAPDRTTNIQALQVPPDSVPAAFRPAPGTPDTMPARIDLVRVLDGSMYFADLTLTPNFATGIRSLDGTIRDLSSAQAAHADVELEGKVDAYAPAKIAGTLNPLNGRGLTDLNVSFKNIELTTFSPYSGKFMGYRIEKGKLDLDLKYRIQNRQLDATNRIFMRQLTLGGKVASPDATRLPVRFAVALLKDRDGNIDLNLPVKGNLDDPSFSVVPIIMKLLVGLVTKAVASPFKLLGAVFGRDDQESPAVHFAFGSAQVDSTDAHALQAVRKGLADRPALRLEIADPGTAAGDSVALLTRRYAAVLRGAAAAAATATPAQIEAARALAPAGFGAGEWVGMLTSAYAGKVGKPPATTARSPRKGQAPDSAAVSAETARLRLMDAQLRARVTVDPIELHGLSRRRSRAVMDVILADSTIAAERVFITGARDSALVDSLGVRLELTLSE